jgi:hypothetical protein
MKQALVHVVGFVTLMGIAGTGWAAAAPGPYYATPSWDQQLPVATRFVVLSNWVDASFPAGGAAVLDRETGLVWERFPSGTLTDLDTALSQCNASGVGNRRGWRLPTVQDLASLVDPTVAAPGPALPAGHPFIGVQVEFFYWSATASAAHADSEWGVGFRDGTVARLGKAVAHHVWCVRGGSGVDAQ